METASKNVSIAGVRRWLLLSVGSLILSGLLALVLSIARTPILADFFTDPVFFRRCLVVHVNLSLGVWLHCFMTAMYFLLPGTENRRAGVGFYLTVAGILLLIAASAFQGAPILSNYIPVIDNPVFLSGLILCSAGILLTIVSRRLIPSTGESLLPAAAFMGLRTAAISFIAAMIVFAISAMTTPRNLQPESYYELLFWGGGHVLIFSTEAVKLVIWLALLTLITGRPPISRSWSSGLFALLLVPPLISLAAAMQETFRSDYNYFFVFIMRWTIFPVTLLFLFFCVRALYLSRKESHLSVYDSRIAGFASSAALTVTGFILGSLIRNSTTLIPAHYHAAIGAVTVSFMAIAYDLLPRMGFDLTAKSRWLSVRQPYVFGAGQIIFATGFALAGANGMGRKLYGSEQHVKGLLDYFGLGLVGLGGLVAVIGGLMFLYIVISSVSGSIRIKRLKDFFYNAAAHSGRGEVNKRILKEEQAVWKTIE